MGWGKKAVDKAADVVLGRDHKDAKKLDEEIKDQQGGGK